MAKPKIILDYLDQTGQKKTLEKLFNEVFRHTLACLGKEGSFEVSLSLVSDKEQRRLNKEYRGIDRTTDVLSFAYHESEDCPMPIDDIGSITISSSVAARQAKEFHHPVEREFAFLFIHGLLHLFGYDHQNEDEANEMFELQNHILNTLDHDFYTDIRVLKRKLKEAQENAVATYSGFHVGACVVLKDGNYITGFNIENSGYTATVCAERVALFTAYSLGYRKDDIAALGCVTESENVGTPCGVCRQVMSELMYPYCKVYIFSNDMTKHLYTTVEELLPYAFTSKDLLGE